MVNVQMLQLILVRAPGPYTVATPMPSTCTASTNENHSISYMYFKLEPWIHILEFLYSANFRNHPLDVNIESKSPNNKAICEPWSVQHAASNTPLYISVHPRICQHMLVLSIILEFTSQKAHTTEERSPGKAIFQSWRPLPSMTLPWATVWYTFASVCTDLYWISISVQKMAVMWHHYSLYKGQCIWE